MVDMELLTHMTRRLIDEGKIIEAGWQSLRLMSVPDDAPAIQIDDMRNTFFAGAQHLFASIISMFDPRAEPTADDFRRMDMIDRELRDFVSEYRLRHLPTDGNA